MTTYPEAQLEAMSIDLESDLVDRKRSGADRSGIRRNICAFANDLPGHGRPGVIFSVRTRIDEHSREHRHPDYPVVALNQFAHNAVMQRSYEGTNAPVQIDWYSDRVEIRSPGGLYGRVNPRNFGLGETDYRNPLVAEMMHHLGFAQRFGLGVPLARKELAKNGNPEPEFRFEPTQVAVTVRAAQ